MPRDPRSFRTRAIILKRQDLGEADRLLTLLTPEHGKLNAVAKGARKPNTSKTGHVELFSRADVLIARGRDLDVLVQAELSEAYLPIREDLMRGAIAGYAVELLDRFTFSGETDLRVLFDLLDVTLQRISTDDDLRRVARYYELHLLDLVGFRPELNECVVTHEAVEPRDQYFHHEAGGVVSPGGASHLSGLITISLPALKLLRHFQRSAYMQVASLQIPESVHNEAERIMLDYIAHILERRLQSVDFIRRLRRLTH